MASNFTNREVEKALKKKGFKDTRDRKHIFLDLYYEDGETLTGIRTCVSHSTQIIGLPLRKKMSDQLKIKPTEFDKFVSCTLSYKEYLALLRENKKI